MIDDARRDLEAHYGIIPHAGTEPVTWGVAFPWLRKLIRPTAREDAIREATESPIHAPPLPPYFETLTLAREVCERLGWGEVLPFSATKAEWVDAQAAVRQCQEDIRRAVWPMAKTRASGHDMLAKADSICRRHDLVLPPDFIITLCRRIALATLPAHARSK
jgi:hypothetical protein